MIRACKILVLCAVLHVAAPTPAQAISIWWLDNFSGPGPFLGADLELRLHCFGEPAPNRAADGEEAEESVAKKVRLGFKSDCLNRLPKGTVLKRSINFTTGIAFSTGNELSYSADVTAGKGVRILNLGPSFAWVSGDETVEFKIGVQENLIFGSAFDTFSRVSVPIVLDFKPFAVRPAPVGAAPSWRDIVTVRVGVVIFPQGFDASDFGAIGDYHTGHEILPTIDIAFDFRKRGLGRR